MRPGLRWPYRTVDGTLEFLSADTAVELANASLLVKLDGDRVLVVAEEACESCRQGVGLALA